MPLRILLYIGRIYEKLTQHSDIYAKELVKIPRPEFIILYNGPDTDWDTHELRLSTAFESASDVGAKGTAPLELTVTAYNINRGHNAKIIDKSEKLAGYSVFIDTVRDYNKELGNLEAAMKQAVGYCIAHNILKDFLELHSSEVINMLFAEWKDEEALEYRYNEGLNHGWRGGKEDDARNMLLDNLPPDKISRYTGLPLAAIQSLALTIGIQTAGQ
jgi:hypothetical protein